MQNVRWKRDVAEDPWGPGPAVAATFLGRLALALSVSFALWMIVSAEQLVR